MSTNVTGGRAVATAKKRLIRTIVSAVADAARLNPGQLKLFGPGVPKAVEQLSQASDRDEMEAAAWALVQAVEWSPAGLPESDKWVMAFAGSLMQLGSCLKDLEVARRVAGGGPR